MFLYFLVVLRQFFYIVYTEFKKDDIIKISGVKEEYADYWKNPTWFDLVKEDETLLHFRGRDGKYKLTLNKGMNAIMMEQLEKASSSSTQNATAMWVIGNDNNCHYYTGILLVWQKFVTPKQTLCHFDSDSFNGSNRTR